MAEDEDEGAKEELEYTDADDDGNDDEVMSFVSYI